MAYSVNQVAKASGITVRTLHFYDEIGLLAPAYVGANGYRFYEEEQLLTLQQILFFRELGMELKEIGSLLPCSDADRAATLRKHRKVLEARRRRLHELIQTIDGTLEHIEKHNQMKAPQFFRGFDPAVQARHEQTLTDRFGPSTRRHIAASKRRVAKWTTQEWERSGAEWDTICRDLVALVSAGTRPEAPTAQSLVKRHFTWLRQFWNPDRESYAGHGRFLADSELRAAYDKYHPELADFLAKAIQVFAKQSL